VNGGIGYVESANYNPGQPKYNNYDSSEVESEDRLDEDESGEYEEVEDEDELEERTVGSVLTIDGDDEKED